MLDNMKKLLFFAALAAILPATVSCSSGEPAKIGIVAHRGFWNCEEAGMTQNSIASLKAAQNNGFWGSEFDVQLTADEVPIVNHNNDINGLLIRDCTLAQLKEQTLPNGEHPSTLDEYLEQGAKCPSTVLVFELKPQRDTLRDDILWAKSVESLKAHGLYDPARVIFISFDLYLCEKIAAEAPEFTNQYLRKGMEPEDLHALGINGIDFIYGQFLADTTLAGRAHGLGMSVNVWTVDADSTMVTMFGQGVDYLTTNEPLLARDLLGGRELRL